ncbi:hypothetical protein MIND_01430800 [Mycena indigotica]|uniref:Uncharacterized protein n=1 Tax=Mycena indigotica TaxID=2126181 RepID=A0A8H6RX15_9AGAR|nr:uncharacterized protein MIND_01430800 [Mycena indigotica]KAF7288486.1 hypothetical protein MIND_01430800 [Mycena indigotica]
MAPIPMPARGAHTTPRFDSTKPAAITTTLEKKKACSRYLSVADQELVEGLDEFSDATKTYEEFKKAALAHYAGNDEDHLHTLKDWDAHLPTELATFYRTFVHMGKFLIAKKRLSETEQSHVFLRALQPASLQAAVKQCLQIIRPNIHADDPYELKDLYEAAKSHWRGPHPLSCPPPTPS